MESNWNCWFVIGSDAGETGDAGVTIHVICTHSPTRDHLLPLLPHAHLQQHNVFL